MTNLQSEIKHRFVSKVCCIRKLNNYPKLSNTREKLTQSCDGRRLFSSFGPFLVYRYIPLVFQSGVSGLRLIFKGLCF